MKTAPPAPLPRDLAPRPGMGRGTPPPTNSSNKRVVAATPTRTVSRAKLSYRLCRHRLRTSEPGKLLRRRHPPAGLQNRPICFNRSVDFGARRRPRNASRLNRSLEDTGNRAD